MSGFSLQQDLDHLYHPPECYGETKEAVCKRMPDPWKQPVICKKKASLSELLRSDVMSIIAIYLMNRGAPGSDVVDYEDLYTRRGRGGSLVDVIYRGHVYRAIGCKIHVRSISV